MKFKVRIPKGSEYSRLVQTMLGENNHIHWWTILSWTLNVCSDAPSFRICRGCTSAGNIDYRDASERSKYVGFRPVFVPLSEDQAKDGTEIIAATLYLDGIPVRVPKNPTHNGDVPMFDSSSRIEFREPLDDPTYQIRAIKVGNVYLADRNVLVNVSWNELDWQGFVWENLFDIKERANPSEPSEEEKQVSYVRAMVCVQTKNRISYSDTERFVDEIRKSLGEGKAAEDIASTITNQARIDDLLNRNYLGKEEILELKKLLAKQ